MNTSHLEEARLIGGTVVLHWCWPDECQKEVMSAQAFHELLRDFDSALSIIEQRFSAIDERHELATAMRKRWFP